MSKPATNLDKKWPGALFVKNAKRINCGGFHYESGLLVYDLKNKESYPNYGGDKSLRIGIDHKTKDEQGSYFFEMTPEEETQLLERLAAARGLRLVPVFVPRFKPGVVLPGEEDESGLDWARQLEESHV